LIKIKKEENLGVMLSSFMKNGKRLALKNISPSRKKRNCGKTSKRKLAKILLD
jgi:exosome complex RNA-binding protein Csl4